ncbi:hypothetical protein GGI23_001775 [Coemansia sp. RSA 2559]|nr:hypothetical protein GGI23_001775 [Coemansia sp. RSA 2559]
MLTTLARLRLLSLLRAHRKQCRSFGATAPTASVLDKVQKIFNQVRQDRLVTSGDAKKPTAAMPTKMKNDSSAAHQRPKEKTPKRQASSAAQSLREAMYPEHKPADASAWMPKVYKDFEQPADAELCKVVIFGTANAGKSTILNRLTGADVSIVSARPQTTRTRIAACATEGHKQLVFLDTPGVVSKQALRRVSRTVVTTPWQTLVEADIIVLLIDAFKLTEKTDEVEKFLFAQLAKSCSVPAVLVVNKIDLIEDRAKLVDKVNEYAKVYPHIVAGPLFVSALGNVNVDELKRLLLARTRPAKWMFPRHVSTDMSDMTRVEECIRAEWFALMHGHLPYAVKQRNVGWEVVKAPVEHREYVTTKSAAGEQIFVENATTRMRKELVIDQELVVPSGSIAKILLGTQGEAIKEIRRAALANITKALGIPVRLHLQVVVEKDTRSQK